MNAWKWRLCSLLIFGYGPTKRWQAPWRQDRVINGFCSLYSHDMFLTTVLTVLLAADVLAQGNPHRHAPKKIKRELVRNNHASLHKREASMYLTSQTQRKKFYHYRYYHWPGLEYSVNGSAIPNVTFDAGESYAGNLSITDDPNNPNQLWFWFWPSSNVNASDEIVIWLNGGPGCSSLDGFFQENGPFLWQR